MSDDTAGLVAILKSRVVKMDGEWTEESFPEHPETHPDCREILEYTAGDPVPKVIYRRA
jgi:hypothetical protein